MARQINQYLGGAVVSPWDVGQLPDEVIDLFQALQVDLPQYQQIEQVKVKAFENFRKEHHYRRSA